MRVVLSRLLLVLLGFFLSAGSFFVSSAPAQAAIPKIIHYQGRLYNNAGTLLGGAGTNYYFKFSIYDTSTVGTGTKLWPTAAPTIQTVGVQYGVFNYDLGDTAVDPTDGDLSSVDFQAKGDTLYLQIDVSSDNFVSSNETLAPRQRIVSQSNALNSEKLQGATPGTGNSNILKLNATGGVDLTGTAAGVSAAGSNTLTLNGSATGNIQFFNSSYTLSNTGALTIGSVTGTGDLTIASGGVAPSNLILSANGAGTITLASSSTGDIQFFSASNKISSSGNLTVAGTITASTTGSLNGVNVNAGAVSGVSTLNLSGAISGATAGNTINGLIINSGALSGISTINASGQITSTLATGTAPFSVVSTTNVANLNASSLNGATFATPGNIGGSTPGAGTFTTLTAQTSVTFGTAGVGGLLQSPIDNTGGTEKGFVLNHTGTALVQAADRLFEVQEGGVAKFSVDKDGLITTGSVNNASVAASAGIVYSKLSLSGSIIGSDLASNISVSTSGNLSTSGSGTISSAGLLTASNGLSVTGTITLPTNSVSDSALSSNVALLAGTQTFSGSKTFSAAVSLGAAGTAGTLSSLINNTAGSETAFVLNHTGSAFAQAGDLLLDIQEGGVAKFSIDRTGLITTASVDNGSVKAAAGIVYSKLSLSNSIVNADINSSAALAYSKLSLTGSIVGGDLASNISISTTGNIATTGSGTITSAGSLTAPSLALTNATNQLTFGTGAGTTGTFSFAVTGGNKTLTFPNATANVCTDASVCSGYQASLGYTAANAALSNLASVAINTSLLPGSDNAIDFGDGTHQLRTAYIGTSLILGTSGANKITLNFTTPTGARTITLPDNGGTVAVAGTSPVSVSATGAISVGDASTSSKGIASFNSTNFTTSSGVVNTIQNINSTATPTFSTLALSSNTNPLVLGTTNTATFALGALGSAQTYTLPTTGGTFATNGSNAISISSAGTTSLNLAGNTASATTSTNSGLVVVSTGLSLLRGCNDQEVEKYFTADNTWRCATGGSGSSSLSAITAATGANSINSGDNAQVWNWSVTTASKSGFTFGEDVASVGSNAILVNLQTLSTSTASPFQVTAGGTANGVKVDTAGLLQAIGTGGIKATTLNGNTFANPGAIGGGTAAAGTFTTLTANTSVTDVGLTTAGVVTNTSGGLLGTLAGTTTTVLHGNASGLPTFASITNSDLSSGTYSNITGLGTLASLTISGGTNSILSATSTATGATDSVAITNSSQAAAGANAVNITFKNNSAINTGATNGLTITEQATTNATGNTANLINLAAAINGTVNAINVSSATGFTNYLKTPSIAIDSSGNITGAGTIGSGSLTSTGAVQGTTLVSTVSTGTAPLTVTSTTNVANLNASSLNGATFANPGTIGSGTPAAGTFTTLTAQTSINSGTTTVGGLLQTPINNTAGSETALIINHTGTAFAQAGDLLLDVQEGGVGKFSVDRTGLITTTSVNNASVATSAGIVYSKLNLTTSIVGGDLATNIGISTTGNIATTGSGTITSAGAFTGPTATNTINGLVISSGALSGVTTINASGQITSTLATGTAPFSVASTTNVANLNASSLNGATFASPGTIGGGTPGAGTFTTLTAQTSLTSGTTTVGGLLQAPINNTAGTETGLIINHTGTAFAQAADLLLDVQEGGVTKANVSKDGNLTLVGTISAATASTINGVSINAGAVSGVTTLGLSGAITGATATNTINSLIINAGALSNITTLSLSGQLTSTLATGTAPFSVASTTNVANLNASSLNGATFANPGTIGGGTPGAATFTTLTAQTSISSGTTTVGGLLQSPINNTAGSETALIINHTGTAFAQAGDLLLDVQEGGVGKFSVDRNGLITTASVNNASVATSAGIVYSKLNLTTSIVGGDLATNISISTTGNIATTGSGTITSAGAFTGPTATNTINGLIINSGALSGVTTVSASGQITSTLATGTAPFSVASTTNVANLNASSLNGATFASPGTIGGGTPGAGTFTTLTAQTSLTSGTATVGGLLQSPINNTAGTETGLIINHTGTAFAQAADLLLDLQEGGVTKASVSKDGNLTLVGTISAATAATINGVSINTGAISGVTTLGLSGAITGATATNTINGLVINSSALSNITTLSLSGQLTSTLSTGTAPFSVASTTNVANLNASSLNGATFAAPGSIGSGTPGSGAFTTLTASTSFGLTNSSNTNDIFAVTNTGLTTTGFEAANFTFKNNNTGAGNTINGVTITESAAATPSGGTNVSNLLNLTGAANGTVNGINFASNLTNYFTDAAGTTKLTSGGALTLASTIAANTTNTINGVSINAGAVSGVTTLGLSGAITGATATNTINGLIINSSALSNITTIGLSGAITGATATNTINGLIINSGALSGVTTIAQAEGNVGAGGNGFTSSATFNGASGLGTAYQQTLTDSTSSTGGFSALQITDSAGTGTGSGNKRLLDLQVGSTASTFGAAGDLIFGSVNRAAATSGSYNLLRLQSGTSLTDVTKINGFGDILSGFTQLDGSSTANGAGTAATALILTSAANFDVGNYVKVSSTACTTGVNICYARITAKASNTLTISPALTWATSSAVTEWHIPEIGGNNTAGSPNPTLTSRFGTGFFINGIITGNGSTYYTDGSITQADASSAFTFLDGNTTSLTIGTSATAVTVAGNLSVTGTLTGSGPTTGASGFFTRSGTTLNTTTGGDAIGITGNISTSANISTTGSGTITSAGAITAPTSVNSINGIIINSGAVSGVSTIGLSGAITGATATNTINGLIINSSALSNITTIGLSGAITGATATNTINGLIVNAGALSGVTGYVQTSGTHAVTSASTSGDASSVTANSLNTASANAVDIIYKNNNTASAGLAVNGISVAATGSAPLSGTNTENLLNLSATALANNTFNAINFGNGLTNYLIGTNFTVTSGGVITAATSSTINGVSINSGAVSGVTTLGLSGAITGATATNTINGLVISSGALSSVSTINASGQFTSTLATGTAPFSVASTTNVANLSASSLNGATFAAPGSIGSGTPGSGAFTTLTASTSFGLTNNSDTNNILSVSNNALATTGNSLTSLTFKNNNGAGSSTINGLTITEQAANSGGTNTSNLINLSSAANGTVNGINFANSGYNVGINFGSFGLIGGSKSAIYLPSVFQNAAAINETVNSTAALSLAVSGSIINISPAYTFNSGTSASETGDYVNVARNDTMSVAGQTLTISGNLVDLSSNCTQTAGTCTDTGKILSLTQSYASASGAVLSIANSGTGADILGTSSTWQISKLGAISAATATNTINNVIINAGAVSNVTTLGLSGAITGATATNTINNLIINAGAISGGTGITSSGSITFSGLSAAGVVHNSAAGLLSTSSIIGGDLATNIAISTTGTIATTSTGTITSAGLLTASNGLTVTGTVTLPANSIADGALSTNVDLLNAAKTFTAAKTFATATSTDDTLTLSPFVGGAARFLGTITSADLTAARTYTLPDAGGTLAVAGSNAIGLSAAGAISLTLSGNTADATTTNNSGLVVTSTGVSLLRGCGASQILKWTSPSWACANDATGAGGSTVTLDPATPDASSANNAIDINKTNAAGSYLNLNRTLTAAGAYSLNEAILTRTVADGGFASTGSILKLIDSGSGTGAVSPDLLLINQASTSSGGVTGNLINAQRSGTTKFSVSSAGVLTLSGGNASDITTTTGVTLTIKPATGSNGSGPSANGLYLVGGDNDAGGGLGGPVYLRAGNGNGSGTIHIGDVDTSDIKFYANAAFSNTVSQTATLSGDANIGTITLNGSSGTGTALLRTLTDSTTSTGGFSALKLTDSAGTGTGTGAKRLLDLQVGSTASTFGAAGDVIYSSINRASGSANLLRFQTGSSLADVFKVTDAGALTLSGAITAPTSTNTINGVIINSGAISNVTTLSLSGQLTSTLSTGTAPFSVASTTNVANLNASSLNGATFSAPGAIGGGTAAAGTFTTLTANTSLTDSGLTAAGVVTNTSGGLLGTLAGTTTTVLHGNASGLPTFGAIVNGDLTSGSYSAITGLGTLSALTVTSTATSGTIVGLTDTSFTADASKLLSATVTNASGTVGATAVSGLDLTLATGTNANNSNTTNGINFPAATITNSNTINGINFVSATGFTNFLKTPSFVLSSSGAISGVTTLGLSGAITGATATNTINGLVINSSALSNISTIGLSGAITGATATNTINSLVINSGALSNITTLNMSGQLTSTLATGTAPFSVASTTNVANLNAASVNGFTFANPGAIGGGTAATALTINGGTNSVLSATSTATGATDSIAFINSSQAAAGANAVNVTFKNNSAASTGATNGLTITEQATTNATGNTANLINLSAAAGGTVNGLNFSGTLTNYTNLVNAGASLTVTGAGAITAGSTYNSNTFTSTALTFGGASGTIGTTGLLTLNGAAGVTINANAASQALLLQQNGVNAFNLATTGALTVNSTSTGALILQSLTQTANASAAVTLQSGNTSTGASLNTGLVSILSGNATGATATAGNVTVDVGTSTTGGGSILIGSASGNIARTISIGTAGTSTAQTINIGTGNSTGANVITLGSLTTTGISKIVLNASVIQTTTGSGGVHVGSDATDANAVPLQLDSYNAFADIASTCSTTVNQGSLFYNTVSGTIRGCVNGAWEDMVSTAGLGLQLFGVVPDTGTNPGDLAGVTDGTAFRNGPCKVAVGSTTATVSWTGCTAYSGGRKVIVTAGTAAATTTNNQFQHLCLTASGNQPALSTSGTEVANLSTVSMASVTAPILCLADIKTSASAISVVYDTRTYTTTIKTTYSIQTTAPALGHLVQTSSTRATGIPNATINGNNLVGVVVATTGAVSSTTINAIVAVSGPGAVKSITSTSNAVNAMILGTATAGYAGGNTARPTPATSTAYNVLGLAQTAWTGATTCAINSDVCAGSVLTYIAPN